MIRSMPSSPAAHLHRGRAERPVARSDVRREGPVRRRGPSDRRRQPRLGARQSGADAARLGGADAARRGRDADRQDDHRRSLSRHPGRERVRRHAAQHPRAGSRAGRLVVRLCRGGRRRAVRHGARHRYRRLGARAGELLRPLWHPPDAWAPRPHRHAAAGAEFGHTGWFARDAATFARVSSVLLGEPIPTALPRRLIVAVDAFGFADAEVAAALRPMVDRLAALIGRCATR